MQPQQRALRDDPQRALRGDICRIGKSLFDRGYVHATAGNISMRLPDDAGGGYLITPTDACLGFLDADRLAWVGDDGTQRGGDRASKTLSLHRRIYDADPQAHCVIHSHSTHLVALTLQPGQASADLLPPITPYFVMKVGHVPRVPYHRPGDPAAANIVGELVSAAAARGAPIRAVMLERLGPVVWNRSGATAMATLEELEETARLWMLSVPRPEPLTEDQIDALRRHFGAHW